MHPTSLRALAFLAVSQLCSCLNLTFTDSQIFYDLSTYNFNNGQNLVQEFALTARPGNVVHLYLFQNNTNQYSIQLFDGPDSTARMISTDGRIPSSSEKVIEPAAIQSSGSSMYIIVSADLTDPTAVVDFQALATDYARPDGCSSTVVSINDDSYLVVDHIFNASPNASCYYIIHANDPTNNPLLEQYVQINQLNAGQFTLYKGLTMDEKRKLVYNELLSSYTATDKYLIVVPTETTRLTFYYLFQDSLDMNLKLWEYTHGTVMSNDYFQDSYPNQNGPLKQQITIEKMPPATVFQITFLNMMGPGTLTVTEITQNITIDETVYMPATFRSSFNNTYDCDKVVLTYHTTHRPSNGESGFYATYDDASDYNVYPSKPTKITQAPTSNPTVPLATTSVPTTKSPTSKPATQPSITSDLVSTKLQQTNAPILSSSLASTASVVVSTSSKPITQRPKITTSPLQTTTKTATRYHCNSVVFIIISSFIVKSLL